MNNQQALDFLTGPAEEKLAARSKDIEAAHDDFMVKKAVYDESVSKFRMSDYELPVTKFKEMVEEETRSFKRDYKDAEIKLKRERERYSQLLDYINLCKTILKSEEDGKHLQNRK